MLSEDPLYSSDSSSNAVRQIMSFTEVVSGNASAGLIASIDVLFDTSASCANTESENQTDSESWPHEHVAVTVIIIDGVNCRCFRYIAGLPDLCVQVLQKMIGLQRF